MLRPRQFPGLAPIREYTSRYGGFRGVDYVSDPQLADDTRSPEAVNLMTDAGGYPEKRPGWRVIRKLDAPINGLHSFTDSTGNKYILAHCNHKLYKITADMDAGGAGDPALISSAFANAKSWSFVHGSHIYFLDGSNYFRYDGTTMTDIAAAPHDCAYTPTTVIGRAPTGGGVTLEAVNLLSPWRKNSFVGNGGVKEVVRLQIYNKATADGNIAIILNGVTASIAVLASDSTVGIAQKIANTTFHDTVSNTDWITVQVGDSVTFTKGAPGTSSPANFDGSPQPSPAGVLAGIVTLTPGAAAATTLQLDSTNLDASAAVKISVSSVNSGEPADIAADKIDRVKGIITYPYAGGTPDGNGVDNIVVTFAKTVYEKDADGKDTTVLVADRIRKCRFGAWFGSGNNTRLFLAGNPDSPNRDNMSGLMDPTYFPDTGYTEVGSKNTAIMGYLRQYSNLLIVKADNGQDATVYMRMAEYDDTGNPYFPLKQGVEGVGAVSSHCFATLRDTPLFLAKEGVFSLTLNYGGVDQQRVAQSRSYFVNPKLIRELNPRDAAACVWDGLYLLAVNGRCYVADGRKLTGISRTEDRSYEWFFWNNLPARVWMVRDDDCYFGTSDGRVCRFNSDIERLERFNDGGTFTNNGLLMEYNHDGKAIPAIWSTKVDDDGDFMRYKNLPRRGSGLLIKPYSRSSVDVYVINDENQKTLSTSEWAATFDFGNIDFAKFSFNTSKNPVVVPLSSPIRRYKTLQIVARNMEPSQGFGLFGIIKRYTVGDYVR